MSYNISVAVMYLSGVALLATSFVSGPFSISQLVFGVLFIILGLVSKSKYSLLKFVDVRISALVWVALSIVTAFLPYLFANTSNQIILWGSISVGLVNLLAVLVSKIELDKKEIV